MIGVPMSEEDVPEGKAHSVAHHLALGPFAAVEQHRLSLALDRDGGDVALDGGAGGAGAQESQGKHLRKVRGEGGTGNRNGQQGTSGDMGPSSRAKRGT